MAELADAPAEPERRRAAASPAPATASCIAWGVLVAVALALRLIALGDRPFHHDESQDAYFSWLFRKSGDYAYNPLLHGPLRFYLTAAMYMLFGDSDFTARLAPGADGRSDGRRCRSALRRQLGRDRGVRGRACCSRSGRATCTSRASPARTSTSPSITLALLVVTFRFLDQPRRYHPALIGALLARSASPPRRRRSSRSSWPGTFFLVALADPGARRQARARRRCARVGLRLALGLGAGRVRGRLHDRSSRPSSRTPSGALDGLYTGLKYWLGQHGVGPRRGAGRSSTASCCSASSGRRCCSGRSARSSRQAPDAAARCS